MFEAVKNFVCALHFCLATVMKRLGNVNPSYGASLFIAVLSFLNVISILMIITTIFRFDILNAAKNNFLWCVILYYLSIVFLVNLVIKNKDVYSSRIKKFNRKRRIKVMKNVVIGWMILSILLLPLSSMLTDIL